MGAVLLLASGCKKTEAVAGEAGAAASAVVPAAPPSGRCKVTTPDTAYDAFFFYPEKNEFMTRMEEGVAVEPMTVTASTAGKVEFTTKPWRDPDKQDAPTTQTGTLVFTGVKWSFDFERNKDADCTVDNFDLAYKPLPEIGIKAGTWSSKDGFSMTFLADGQRFLQKYKKEEKVIYYRVLDKTDAGIVIGTSATPPSSASGDIWFASTLTPVGDKLNVTMKDLHMVLSYAGPPPGTTPPPPVAAVDTGSPSGATPKAAVPIVKKATDVPAPTPAPEPPKEPPAGPTGAPFDRGAAASALGAVSVQSCKRPGGPTGSGHVKVMFAPDGSASAASVDGPFAGTDVGTCIEAKYRSARVPAFNGTPTNVGKSFTIN